MRTEEIKLATGTVNCALIVRAFSYEQSFTCFVYSIRDENLSSMKDAKMLGDKIGWYDSDNSYAFEGLEGLSEVNRVVEICKQEIENFKNR